MYTESTSQNYLIFDIIFNARTHSYKPHVWMWMWMSGQIKTNKRTNGKNNHGIFLSYWISKYTEFCHLRNVTINSRKSDWFLLQYNLLVIQNWIYWHFHLKSIAKKKIAVKFYDNDSNNNDAGDDDEKLKDILAIKFECREFMCVYVPSLYRSLHMDWTSGMRNIKMSKSPRATVRMKREMSKSVK